MKIVHRLVGYGRRSDRMKLRYDLPPDILAEAKRIAGVAPDDREAAWSYPLSTEQAKAIGGLVRVQIDPDQLEFFLEPFGDSIAENGTG